jgi:hypothetical protein
MADQKISAMPAAAALTGAELVPLVQSGANVQSTISSLSAFTQSSLGAYGAWQDTTTQTGSTTTPTAFTINTVDANGGIALSAGTRLTVPNTGVYNLQWSGQFSSTDVNSTNVWVWVRINGADLSGSTGLIGMLARKSNNIPSHVIVGWNYFLTLTAGQYVEFYWLKETENVLLTALPASVSPAYPSTASLVVTMNQVG